MYGAVMHAVYSPLSTPLNVVFDTVCLSLSNLSLQPAGQNFAFRAVEKLEALQA